MELRDSLLQNELDHLANNFRLLSGELLLLQDFMKKEFGTKYAEFCKSRRVQGSSSSITPRGLSSSKVTKTGSKKRKENHAVKYVKACKEMEFEEESAEPFGEEEIPCIFPDSGGNSDASNNNSDLDYNPGFIEEDSDSIEDTKPDVSSLDTLYGNDPEEAKKGRRRSIVYRYFDKVEVGEGRCKDKCRKCGNLVSSQAQRLRKHLIKCNGDKGLNKLIVKLNVPKERELELNEKRKGGRTYDRVRLLFNEHKTRDGYLKMQCLKCKQLVSNQAQRMRKHLGKCTKEKQDVTEDLSDEDHESQSNSLSKEPSTQPVSHTSESSHEVSQNSQETFEQNQSQAIGHSPNAPKTSSGWNPNAEPFLVSAELAPATTSPGIIFQPL